MPTGTAMHYVVGSDRPVPTFTRYSEPKAKQTGLDWSKHRAPEPTLDETTAALQRDRVRAAAAAEKARRASIRTKTVTRCSCGRAKTPAAAQCRPCADQSRRAPQNHCDCGATIARTSTRCAPCARRLNGENARGRTTGPRGPRALQPAPFDVDAATTDYQAGTTVPELATRLGISRSTIRRHLRRAGVQLRDDRAGHSGGQPKFDDPLLVAQVRDLYASGLSQDGVGHQLGLTQKQISRIMSRHGITARSGQHGSGDTLGEYRERITALGVTTADIRSWARRQDIEVTTRGAVSYAVLTAYEKAHA